VQHEVLRVLGLQEVRCHRVEGRCRGRERRDMRVTMLCTVALAAAAAAGTVTDGGSLDPGRAVLQYDDGSPSWFIWGGTYRGVWFDLQDFSPGASGFLLEVSEYWMYHHSSYAWDTSVFLAEVWSGGPGEPALLLDQNLATAVHFAPIYVYHAGVDTPPDFWILENVSMSSGGWPSISGDASPPPVTHSFVSDDMQVWEPSWMGDFLIRGSGDFETVLDAKTWGAIKAVF
jgi:hypothetical protein